MALVDSWHCTVKIILKAFRICKTLPRRKIIRFAWISDFVVNPLAFLFAKLLNMIGVY